MVAKQQLGQLIDKASDRGTFYDNPKRKIIRSNTGSQIDLDFIAESRLALNKTDKSIALDILIEVKALLEHYSVIFNIVSNNSITNPVNKFIIDLDFSNIDAYLLKYNNIRDHINSNKDVLNFLIALDYLYNEASINKDIEKLFFTILLLDIIENGVTTNRTYIKNINTLKRFIDHKLYRVLKDIEREINNNKNTALDDEKPTTNTLDDLKEQKDNPQRGRVGRDFKSVSWTNQPKTKSFKKERQPTLSIRTFQQVFEAIDMAREESGELKNEWIIRAIIDRLATDHPAAYEWLKEQKGEFPDVRSDARTGIDFILEKN